MLASARMCFSGGTRNHFIWEDASTVFDTSPGGLTSVTRKDEYIAIGGWRGTTSFPCVWTSKNVDTMTQKYYWSSNNKGTPYSAYKTDSETYFLTLQGVLINVREDGTAYEKKILSFPDYKTERAICGNDNVWIVVGSGGRYAKTYDNFDSITYGQESGYETYQQDVWYGETDDLWLTCAEDINNRGLYSFTDGVSFGVLPNGTMYPEVARSLCDYNGLWVCVGGAGEIGYAPSKNLDGIPQFVAAYDTGCISVDFNKVRSNNGVFYAVVDAGALYYSTDGNYWNRIETGVTVDLLDIYVDNEIGVIVGGADTVLVSV